MDPHSPNYPPLIPGITLHVKPLLGAEPRYIWLNKRATHLARSISAYLNQSPMGDDDSHKKPIMVEWSEELTLILKEITRG